LARRLGGTDNDAGVKKMGIMGIKYHQLKGMEVLAHEEGRLLGSVKRIQLDSKTRKVLSFVYRDRLISKEHWSNVEDIERVGQDVIFIRSLKEVRDGEPKGRDIKNMLGLPVNTMNGQALGGLDDLLVDPQSWKIMGVVLDSSGVVEVDSDAVFGEDMVLLDKAVDDVSFPEKGEEEPEGGFLARLIPSDTGRKKKKTVCPKTTKSKAAKKKKQ
jgi:uncharacterized protein YrrD